MAGGNQGKEELHAGFGAKAVNSLNRKGFCLAGSLQPFP